MPRAKPAPKEKPKTKWEKFREEKGLPARKKRSRLVFDPISNDWVPRWGPNSKKKIEAKHEWLLEDKPTNDATGVDPFTQKRQEKKLHLEKEKLRKIKNEMHALKEAHGKTSIKGVTEVLRGKTDAANEAEVRKQQVKKRERKALDKSLQLAQLSTASMGKFDKKVSKHEPDAPASQKVLKKKSNQQLAKLQSDPKGERERNMKILNFLERSGESKASSKAEAHMDVGKMVARKQKKEDKFRRAHNK